MDVIDSFYRRLSFSPSKSRTSTPNIIYRAESSSRLSKEDIDEILESPYETDYTYSYTFAYKPHIGCREYIHPRLCRRFNPSPTNFNKIEQQLIFTIIPRIFIWIFLQVATFISLICSTLYFYLYIFFGYALKPVYGINYRVQNYWNEIKYVWLNSEGYWQFTRSLFYSIIFREFNDYSTNKKQRFSKQTINKHRQSIKTRNFTFLKLLIFLSILYLIYLLFTKLNENQDEFDKICPLENQKSDLVQPFCTNENKQTFQSITKRYLFVLSENILNNAINIYYGTIHGVESLASTLHIFLQKYFLIPLSLFYQICADFIFEKVGNNFYKLSKYIFDKFCVFGNYFIDKVFTIFTKLWISLYDFCSEFVRFPLIFFSKVYNTVCAGIDIIKQFLWNFINIFGYWEKVTNAVIYIAEIVKLFFIWIYGGLINLYQNLINIILYFFNYSKEYYYNFFFKTTENVFEEKLFINKEKKIEKPLSMQFLHKIIYQTLAEERIFLEKNIRKWIQQNIKIELKLNNSDETNKNEIYKKMTDFEDKIVYLFKNFIAEQEEKLEKIKLQMEEKMRLFVNQQDELFNNRYIQINDEIKYLKTFQEELDDRFKKEKPLNNEKEMIKPIEKKNNEFDENALMKKIRHLIKKEIRLYEADRTGMPDFALESSGGSVLSTRCTVQYNERSRTQKLFGIPLWYTSYSPRTVIQRKGYGASAGECWAFYGGHGFLTIGLSGRINVTAVSYEHLPIELSPDGHIRTAPKNFLVWSYQDVDNMLSRMLLGNFTYNSQGEPLQIFYVQKCDSRLTNIIELETLTNWGSSVTCLYRFRVHGDALKIIPDVSEENDDKTTKTEVKHKPFSTNKFKTDEKDLI